MKKNLKIALNFVCKLIMLPLAALCMIEQHFLPQSELVFNTCAQLVSILPGIPGAFLRRGFYHWTLEKCSLDCHIGFGTIFSHRETIVEDHVYIGNYALIGSAHLHKHCLIGSRTSILSGKALHVIGDDGLWTPYTAERLARVVLGTNVWVGESAVIVADVGDNSMVGAGAVVTTAVKPGIIVTGNPARFVGKLQPETPKEKDSTAKPKQGNEVKSLETEKTASTEGQVTH